MVSLVFPVEIIELIFEWFIRDYDINKREQIAQLSLIFPFNALITRAKKIRWKEIEAIHGNIRLIPFNNNAAKLVSYMKNPEIIIDVAPQYAYMHVSVNYINTDQIYLTVYYRNGSLWINDRMRKIDICEIDEWQRWMDGEFTAGIPKFISDDTGGYWDIDCWSDIMHKQYVGGKIITEQFLGVEFPKMVKLGYEVQDCYMR
jgi:hypothetical protein